MSIHIYFSFHGVRPGVIQLKLIDFGLFLRANFVSESKTKINYIFLFEDWYTVISTGIDSSLLRD